MDKTSQQLEVVSTGTPLAAGRTLILLGHGSHLNADSAAAVRRHARAVRARGLFGEVLEGYWKEEPSLRQLLRLARFRDVTVVPLFVSEGYFTGTVIPRELGLDWRGPVPPGGLNTVLEGRRVHYTRPYGVHPAMTGVIAARAAEVRGVWEPGRTALVVLGHGTGRDRQSQQAILQAAAALREGGQFAEVQALYLDQRPRVEDWPDLTRAPDVVIVPFFASEGWHTQETIPHDLGLGGPVTEFPDLPGGPRRVFYSRPVGTHPDVTGVIVRLVEECRDAAGSPEEPAWQAAGEALLRAVRASEAGLAVGEVQVTPRPGGRFDLRSRKDAGRGDLTPVAPADLAAWTGRAADGAHRPIRTRRSLPRGWQTEVDAGGLRAALHAVYPAVLEEAHAWDTGTLPVLPWEDTAARQSGLYAAVRRAGPAQVAQARARTCAGCLRTPLWAGETLGGSVLGGNVPGRSVLGHSVLSGDPLALPCPEACTLLVAAVREELSTQTPPKPPHQGALAHV